MENTLPQTQNIKPARERVVFLDYLRVIACFMVMVIHSCEPLYIGGNGLYATYIANMSDAIWVTLIDSPLRVAVPLFIIASSYLMFPLKTDATTFFKRRFSRVAFPLVFWVLMYSIFPFFGGGYPTLDGVLANLNHAFLNFPDPAGHLWFVYMLLGIYILMPMLSPWVDKLSKRGEEIFLGVWLFTTLVPFLKQAAIAIFERPELWGEANWNEFGTLYYISGFVGYLVMGHYFRKYVPALSWSKTLAWAFPLFLVGVAITMSWFWWQIPKSFPVDQPIALAVKMEQSWRYCSIGVALMTAACFLVIRKINFTGTFYERVILPISDASYGMYLMHMFALVFFISVLPRAVIPTPLWIFAVAICSFVTSAIVMRLVRFLPGNKFIG